MRWRSVVAVAVASSICGLAVQQVALALNTDDPVTFLLPLSGNLPEPPQGPSDKLIYTGGRVVTVTVDGTNDTCPTGTFAVQNGVLVDPDGGRSSRIIGIVTLEPAETIDPGTRVGTLAKLDECSIDGTSYAMYSGRVQ